MQEKVRLLPADHINGKRKSNLALMIALIVLVGLVAQVVRVLNDEFGQNNVESSSFVMKSADSPKKKHLMPAKEVEEMPDLATTDNEVIDIINEEEEYEDVLEKDEQFETQTFLEGQADWLKYDNVRQGQNCSAEFRLFSQESNRPIVALSSFPGSGNTWARHLLHMATGYWTGNRRSSNHLKAAGWAAEDNDCKDRTTIAQKTHRLSKNKACEFEQGLVLIRNPFDAILAAYNHHKAGKTGEPPMDVYEGAAWPRFVHDWAKRWYQFHHEWFVTFEGPVQVSCFDQLVADPVSEVGEWLKFLELDNRRLGCIHYDPVGQFYRKKTLDYSHLFAPTEAKLVHSLIKQVQKMLKDGGHGDCTAHFKYDKCC